jgi:hypothetical protein
VPISQQNGDVEAGIEQAMDGLGADHPANVRGAAGFEADVRRWALAGGRPLQEVLQFLFAYGFVGKRPHGMDHEPRRAYPFIAAPPAMASCGRTR